MGTSGVTRPGTGRKAARSTKSWGHSVAELRRAGRYGNAIAMPPKAALRLLHDWHATRHAAVVAGLAAFVLVAVVAVVVGLGLRFTLRMDGIGAVIASTAIMVACEGARRTRFWRLPIALTLIRYRMARA